MEGAAQCRLDMCCLRTSCTRPEGSVAVCPLDKTLGCEQQWVSPDTPQADTEGAAEYCCVLFAAIVHCLVVVLMPSLSFACLTMMALNLHLQPAGHLYLLNSLEIFAFLCSESGVDGCEQQSGGERSWPPKGRYMAAFSPHPQVAPLAYLLHVL